VFPKQGRIRWPDGTIAEVVKYGTKDKVEIFLPAWITHDFPKELQIIAHHELQSLITVPFPPHILGAHSYFLVWPLKPPEQVHNGFAPEVFNSKFRMP
jgi:hypothetical protein